MLIAKDKNFLWTMQLKNYKMACLVKLKPELILVQPSHQSFTFYAQKPIDFSLAHSSKLKAVSILYILAYKETSVAHGYLNP